MRPSLSARSRSLHSAARLGAALAVAAALSAVPAFAQGSGPSSNPKSPTPKASKAATKKLAPGRLIESAARAPAPTFDEGTAQRIASAMLSYSAIEVRGGWPTLPASAVQLAPGITGPDVVLLRQRLEMTDDLPPEPHVSDVYDDGLAVAVRRFQSRHGLEQTGAVGRKTLAALNVPVGQRLRQLSASLDRLAGTDFLFGQRYVVVNIPAAFVEAVDGDKVVRRHTVVVGKRDRPSPMVTTAIAAVNLNPTWTVPLSILKKDIVPKMRKDPRYLARMHMRVLDGAGREIDPRSIDWWSGRSPNFTVRQDSGTWNALGAVRIDMPNAHAVYLHDTNHKEHFGTDYRFQSSGCARLENPRDFAAWLLEDLPNWSRREIDAGIAKGQRIDIRLPHKVPVAWVYLTGWATRDGTIHFRDDIYGHDGHPARPMVADIRSGIVTAARASGFVLQSSELPEIRQASYLDSQ
jgi:murein L,D-transpeptidase YcbB/YkuD